MGEPRRHRDTEKEAIMNRKLEMDIRSNYSFLLPPLTPILLLYYDSPLCACAKPMAWRCLCGQSLYSFLEHRARAVFPKDRAQDVADLTQGGVFAHRVQDEGHEIVRALGSGLKGG